MPATFARGGLAKLFEAKRRCKITMNFKQRLLSQNFLKDPLLVSRLVREVAIGKNDLVVDIGAGTGVITFELAKVAGRVVALEVDQELIPILKSKLKQQENVEIHQADIRQFPLPSGSYKVFSNPPFHLTADIIYKLLQYSNPPEESFLIVQKEVAEKFTGCPHETQASILLKVHFDFKVLWRFQKSDFKPPPDVDTVLLQISKRSQPFISSENEFLYKAFIKFAFNTWKKDLKVGLKQVFTYEQWKRLAKNHKFNIHSKPTDLSFDQWLAVFSFFESLNTPLLTK